MWTWIFTAAALAGLVVFLFGIFRAVRTQGEVTRREGAEVHADLVARQAQRDSRLEGEAILGQRTKAWGVGKEIGGEATISWKAIALARNRNDRELLAPWVTVARGAAVMIPSTALALLTAGGLFAIAGAAFLLVGVRIVWVCRRGLRRAERELATGSAGP